MKRLALFAITAALTALTASPPVLGQQKQNGQEREAVEPIVTEESLPNERGEYDFRWNLAYGRNGRRGAGALPGFEFFFGVSERIGAEISVPVVYKSEERTHYGLGDVSATVKALLVKQGTRAPAFVAGVEAGFPTGNPTIGTGDGAYEVAPFIALLKDLGPFTVQGNVGWSRKFAGSPATPRGEYFYNSAFDTPVHGKKLFLFAEINGIFGNGFHENKLSIAPGIRYIVSKAVYLGFAFPVGLNNQTDRWGVVNQFQFGFRSPWWLYSAAAHLIVFTTFSH